MLVFDKDIGAALGKACEQDSDGDAVHLARAAQIVMHKIRNQLIESSHQQPYFPYFMRVLIQ